ncbi:MAG TPA: response regulator transcription factor [Anaerolineales bacterium]|nr:response regulator transcription factor [Anaerolineales bacterium]
MREITLLVADDHPLFRQGVVDALSLEKDFRVIAQASNGVEALSLIRSLKPMVAILDVSMPGLNGQQVTHQVTSEHLPTNIVLLTGYDDVEQAIHAVLAGAAGYCAKEIEPEVLARTIRAVADGRYAIGGNIFTRRELDRWIDEQIEGARRSYSEPGSPFHPLSDREMEVLSCVVRGMSNKEIATRLGISHQTVKNHVTSILRKFNVEDRTQAVVYALKRGWIKLRDTALDQE